MNNTTVKAELLPTIPPKSGQRNCNNYVLENRKEGEDENNKSLQ